MPKRMASQPLGVDIPNDGASVMLKEEFHNK
jgi:hypothetical protein